MLNPLLFLSLTASLQDHSKWKFTSNDNYFQQYTNDSITASTSNNFGLNPDYTWLSLLHELKSKTNPDKDIYYKLIFWARHGEAVHNVVKGEVGHDAWKTIGEEDTYKDYILYDDDLTSDGIAQVQDLASVWTSAINSGAPVPESYYCSPLQRTLHTFELTWGSSQSATVVENLREKYGRYSSYERHNKTWIEQNYPQMDIEEGFEELDVWGVAPLREKKKHVRKRIDNFLKDLYLNDNNMVISITTHSGIIEQLLHIIGHPAYDIPTGSLIPTVIIGKKKNNH